MTAVIALPSNSSEAATADVRPTAVNAPMPTSSSRTRNPAKDSPRSESVQTPVSSPSGRAGAASAVGSGDGVGVGVAVAVGVAIGVAVVVVAVGVA